MIKLKKIIKEDIGFDELKEYNTKNFNKYNNAAKFDLD